MGDTHIYYSQHHNIITQHSPAKSATQLLTFPPQYWRYHKSILNRLSFNASDRAIAKQTGRIMFGSARGCDFEEYYKPPPTGEHVCPDTQRRIYD